MPTPEERIAALESEVESLRQHLLNFMNSSTAVARQVADLAAENSLLSRAVVFLGIFWSQSPGMPKRILADVHATVMNGIDADLKVHAPRTIANLSHWLK